MEPGGESGDTILRPWIMEGRSEDVDGVSLHLAPIGTDVIAALEAMTMRWTEVAVSYTDLSLQIECRNSGFFLCRSLCSTCTMITLNIAWLTPFPSVSM